MFAVKTVLITGAGRGIGRKIALDLAQNGCRVAIAARSASELEATLQDIRQFQKDSVAVTCDVSNPTAVEELFQKVEASLGPVDAVVAAAAIHGPIGPFTELALAEWKTALEVNVMGTAYTVQRALKKMSTGGRIVLFSGGGEKAFSGFSAYVASKGAIWRFTETLAEELRPREIAINAIAPGAVNTKLLQNVLDAGPEKVGQDYFDKSLVQKSSGGTPPTKAVALVRYLLSERSRGLSGKILSAVWDDYENWRDLEAVSRSDAYTMRRVVPKESK